ncbi:LysR substrate-binding domain-containing protein [Micromonospora sp. NPDC005806]|uniref:LysR substrate-binding domain-containing protein n=1 Tax=Micromonospora sp. NPDC005806 TaxID=3364234 RepID=UPI00367E9997
MDRAARRRGGARRVLLEVADLRMLPEYVSAGLGVAVVPDVVPLAAPGTAAVPLRDPGLTWPLSIVTHGRKAASRVAATHSCTVTLAPIQRDNVVGTGPHYLRAANRNCLGLAVHDRVVVPCSAQAAMSCCSPMNHSK